MEQNHKIGPWDSLESIYYRLVTKSFAYNLGSANNGFQRDTALSHYDIAIAWYTNLVKGDQAFFP